LLFLMSNGSIIYVNIVYSINCVWITSHWRWKWLDRVKTKALCVPSRNTFWKWRHWSIWVWLNKLVVSHNIYWASNLLLKSEIRPLRRIKIFDLNQHLAGHDFHETLSGPDPDPNYSTVNKSSQHSRKVEKGKGTA